MSFNISATLNYPFRSDNWKQIVLWPGISMFIFMIICGVLMGILYVIAIAAGGLTHSSSDLSAGMGVAMIPFVLLTIVIICLQMLLTTAFLGYNWNLVSLWLEQGMEATAPLWKGNIKRYFVDGLKLFIFYLVFGLLYAIPCLLIAPIIFLLRESDFLILIMLFFYVVFFIFHVLISPFMMAFPFIAAQDRSLGSLFNVQAAFQLGAAKYGRALLAMLIMMGLMIVLMIPIIIIHFVTCGAGSSLIQPFLMMPIMVVQWNLYYQVFKGNEPPMMPEPRLSLSKD